MDRISKEPVRWLWCAGIMSISLFAGCAREPSPTSISPHESTDRLSEIQSWAYQLQDITPDDLAALDVDLIVMDYADDGIPFPREEIAQIKSSGKVVLSYLSIGEAETYRPYWDQSWGGVSADDCSAPLSEHTPDWIEPMNPEWCGNYPVQFWRAEWQSILIDYLDAILAAGFDGVYLDKVDTFYYWLGEEDMGQSFSNPDAPRQMVELVGLIAKHGREKNPDFILVPQNATEIIEYLSEEQQTKYLNLIDGIGVEDTFFYPPDDAEVGENAPYNPQKYVLDLLFRYQETGLPVFAVDYVTEPEKIENFFDKARECAFVPYTSSRALDRIGTTKRP